MYRTESSYIVFKSNLTYIVKDGFAGTEETYMDTAEAINQAINKLTTGGLINIKKGTYILTNSVIINNDNVVIQGEGKSTVLKVNDSTYIIAFKILYSSNVIIRDIEIDGNKANQSQKGRSDQELIYVYDSLNLKFSNLHVHDGADKGILIKNGVKYCTITNCKVNNNYAEGIHVYTSTKMPEFCSITNNLVMNNGLAGIAATGLRHIISDNIVKQNEKDGIFISGRELVVNNNVVDNNGDCGIGGDDSWVTPFRGNTITGNTVLNNRFCGISFLNAQKMSITGNVIHSNGYSKKGVRDQVGIRLEGNSFQNEITGNVCYNEVNDPTPNQLYGVGTFDTSDYNLIVGNTLRDNGKGAHILTGTHNVVANNIL